MTTKEVKKILVFDDSDYAKNKEVDLKADKSYVNEELIKKQNKLIYSGDNQNIATINNESLEGKKNISVGGNPFTDLELQKIRSILDNFAYGYNKVTGNFQQFGSFSEQTIYSDLDKPDDNLVTDKIGEAKDIRKVNFAHYSGNAWYGSDGKTISLRDYQDKLTYKGDEIALKKDCVTWIEGEYKWMPINSEMPEGWKKVNIRKGFTLIQGEEEGTDKGMNLYHNHAVTMILPSNDRIPMNGVPLEPKPLKNWSNSIMNTNDNGHPEGNFAAGKYAELWQYDPNNKWNK